MIPGVAFHLQRSMLLAENKKVQVNMDYKEKSISTLISSNHLMHRDQTDNI
jgi:hypothetical protein